MSPRSLLVWVGPVEPVRDDVMALLCVTHADRLTVPHGWTLVDERDGSRSEVVPAVEQVIEQVIEPEVEQVIEPEVTFEPVEQETVGPAAYRPAVSEPAGDTPRQGLLFDEYDPIQSYEIESYELDETELDETDLDETELDETEMLEHDEAPSWPPVGAFDPDDTGPLPDVSGPLLSRAFRGQGPPAGEHR
jgi:hypothetical protein